jgi:hypothetical protein
VLAAVPRFGASLEAFWRGQVPLVSAFWDWGVLVGLLVHAAGAGAFLWAVSENASLAVKTLVFAAPIPYSLFVLVAVWRSAAAYAGPPWRAKAARWAIVVWTAVLCVI